jgi:hypothetical protein
MGNTACRVGNKHLLFDGQTETFTNGDQADKLVKGTYRKGYEIPDNV